MNRRALVWFRRDLRLRENPALAAALSESAEIVPVFVFDRALLDSPVFGAACVGFMVASLEELAVRLQAQGRPLQWRIGDPREEIPRLAKDLGVDAVYWNRDYEPAAVQRDQMVRKALSPMGIVPKTFKDHLVFEPEDIRTLQGQPFQRYSAFRSAWWKQWMAISAGGAVGTRFDGDAAPLLPVDRTQRTIELPSCEDLGYERVPCAIPAGERAGQARLQAFVRDALHRYSVGRNLPAADGTAMLSPHFRFGTVAPRTAVQAALGSLSGGGAVSRAAVHTWIDELVWREFFHHVMVGYPHVVDGPFRLTATVPPPRPPDDRSRALFDAWCAGRTGYPIVDAGMRQLNTTGWMHNRVRMVAASFLVKDLRLDWRWGERYFMARLVDADLAVNNGNWQWCASTGTDAMPGYRIFNPMLQGKKFDPSGDYVRRYVPELAAVPTGVVHAPHEMSVEAQARAGCRLGVDYPRPIVEHAQARAEYLALAQPPESVRA